MNANEKYVKPIRASLKLKLKCAPLVAQLVKSPPAMQETWLDPWVWKSPQKKEMATHSRIPAWKIPGKPHGVTRLGHNLATKPQPQIKITKIKKILVGLPW